MERPFVAHTEQAREVFRTFLRERGQRQTPERFAVLEALYHTGDHVDADALYQHLRDEADASVSRATVYNTLDLLVEAGLATRHQFDGSHARYERAYAYAQHDHLICTDCGHIYEFCDPRLHDTQQMIGQILGFAVARHSLTLYGQCRRDACPNRAESDDA
ncbi:MAG: transcriptional repressor [Rhodothermales bacterium]|nr:transcriptional repressor [Rhodothermales bacterium]